MKGTIKIIGGGYGCVAYDVEATGVSWFDKIIMFDSLATVLELNEEERKEVATVTAVGGIGALTGKSPTTIEIAKSFLEQLKRKGKQNDETTA